MNKVCLLGRLTKDPEMRYTAANNTALCTFTIAVDRRFQRQGEEKQADFILTKAWGKTAEFVNNYFTKGKRIAITGRIEVNSWDDNDGKRRWSTDVVAEDVFFVDSKKDGAGSPGKAYSGDQTAKAPVVELNENTKDATDGFYPLEEDDDLPF
jgi:single-strand DNA-binding protein